MAKKSKEVELIPGTVVVSVRGVAYLAGRTTITESGAVVIEAKAARSRKMEIRTILPNDVLTVNAGEEGSVQFYDTVVLAEVAVEDANNALTIEDGFIYLADADETVVRYSPEVTVTVVSERFDADGAETAPKAAGKKKPAAVEEDEEEEEEDEEEEEEEAPKKKAGRPAAKPAAKAASGKGGKKKAVDPDWDEDE